MHGRRELAERPTPIQKQIITWKKTTWNLFGEGEADIEQRESEFWKDRRASIEATRAYVSFMVESLCHSIRLVS